MSETVTVSAPPTDWRVSVAPMMEWTDRHCRHFLRLFNPDVRLYTEMITTGALLHGDAPRFLRFDASEHPIAIQLGGSDPEALARCARMAEDWGYDEVNLNCGCPSDRVQQGKIGACLMAEPQLVADCIAAMRAAVRHVPVTVKSRIGINGRESYEELHDFIATVAATGCDTFVVHARIAILRGLSPKENREIPPLKYEVVHRLKADFPHLRLIVNGGIKTVADVQEQLTEVDGVMIGREAYHNPWLLADIGSALDHRPPLSRHEVLERFLPFMTAELEAGTPLSQMTRHILGLFQGLPGARRWRQHISENAHRKGAGLEVVTTAARLVPDDRMFV